MSLVNIININLLNNPSQFISSFQFEITFQCLQDLKEDLEWKVVYVGNPEDECSGDQVLEEVAVGPVAAGNHNFILETTSPNPSLIHNDNLLGVSVVLIICSYMSKEFIRIGYYLSNEYSEPYDENSYPNPVFPDKIYRNVIANEPRVTRIPIVWDEDQSNANTNSYLDIVVVEESGNNANETSAMMDDNYDVVEEDDDDDNDDEVDLESDEYQSGYEVIMEEDSMDVNVMQPHSHSIHA